MDWYNDDEAKENAGAITDDDRQQIQAILDVPSFYNKSEILALQGDHDRATGLVRLIRDKDFYAGKGEIIWRVEVWYFKYQHGGWEKVAQQNKILRRERFKNRDDYELDEEDQVVTRARRPVSGEGSAGTDGDDR